MIYNLDQSIKQLLRQEAKLSRPPYHIAFEIPDEQWQARVDKLNANEYAINIYLYDVRENRKLRSNERWKERVNGKVKERQVPARMDCMYLITAWKPAPQAPGIIDSSTVAQQEHQVLSRILHTLLRFPVLPATVLQGSLAMLTPVPELPTSVAQPDGIKNLGEFWSSVKSKWRPALQYMLTLPFEVFAELEAPEVASKVMRYGQLEDPREVGIRPPLLQDLETATDVHRTGIVAAVAQLSLAAKKGTQQLTVAAARGVALDVGHLLLIGGGANTEFVEVKTRHAGGKLSLASPLRFDHGIQSWLHRVDDGERIGEMAAVGSALSTAISVDESAAIQIEVGDVLKLGGTGHVSYVQVTSIGPATRGLAAEPETLVRIGGRVLQKGAPDTPVTGARVTLAELDLIAHSDGQGRFTFSNLSPGTYHLGAEAPGYQVKNEQIQVPGTQGEYDITLAP